MSVVPISTDQYILLAIGQAASEAQSRRVSFAAVQPKIERLSQTYPLYEASVVGMSLGEPPILGDLLQLRMQGFILLDHQNQWIDMTDLGILAFWSLSLPEESRSEVQS